MKKIALLAGKHGRAVELMPYQKQGERVKLLISVYLRKPEHNGQMIVVLLRKNYPSDIESLRTLVRTALARLRTASSLREQFAPASIESAEQELEQILQETQKKF